MTPLKSITISRLELSAAVLAVKLYIMLRKCLTTPLSDPSIFWCDSTAVLQTIANNTKRFPTFVANRVAIIERNTNLSHRRYVPRKKNPDDLATRYVTISSFPASSCHVWLNGPEFLTKPEDYWPANACPLKDLPIEFTLKEKLANVTSVSFGGNTAINLLLKHFSSYYSLLKATAWLLRFKFYLKTKVNNSQSYFLTTSELKHAEKCLIYTQHK